MVLIIGGACQGKLDYVKETYRLREEEIFTCTGLRVDFSRRCIDRLEEFTYACVQAGADAAAYFHSRRGEWEDSILICRDISGGVVPLGGDMREWRNMTGQLCQYLAKEAQRVSRIFCGLEHRLK